MKAFLITVKAMVPYPKDFVYRVEASSLGAAAAKACKLFRKDVPKKRLGQLTIYIQTLCGVKNSGILGQK